MNFVMKPEESAEFQPDPLLLGGVWAQDYCYVSVGKGRQQPFFFAACLYELEKN